MRSMIILVSLFYFFQLSCGTRGKFDYYWRDYTGTIPKDAVPGGRNSKNKTTYIGQGYVKNHGLIPGNIFSGQESITVPFTEPVKVPHFVKILCSPNLHAFKWVSATQQNFHTEMIGKFPVPGGFEDGNVLHIGRTSKQGSIKIGKVLTESTRREGKSPMYFMYKGDELTRDSYQVLIYDNN